MNEKQLYEPNLYALTHTGNEGDIAFYANACKSSELVLELGCGDGRITIPLIQKGCRVVAMDNHPGMIRRLKEKAAELIEKEQERLTIVLSDMASFDVRGLTGFDVVIIPYNSLLCLLSIARIESCFQQIAEALNPGGRIIFDIYHVPPMEEDDEDVSASLLEYSHVKDILFGDNIVPVYEKSLPHSDPNRFDVSYMYRLCNSDGSCRDVEYKIEQRCLFENEIYPLLENAGFEAIQITGDFTCDAVHPDTSQLVVTARLLGND